MKTTFRILLGMAAFFAVSSCQDVTSPINSLTLSVKEIAIASSQTESAFVEVSSSAEWNAEFASDASGWLSFKKEGDKLLFTAEPNTEISERSATVNVFTSDRKLPVVVRQAGIPVYFTISPGVLQVPKEGGSYQLTVESNIDWTIDATDNWMEFSSSTGSAGTTDITVTVPGNEDFVNRNAIIGFYKDMKRFASIDVAQDPFVIEIFFETDTFEAPVVAGSSVIRFSSNYAWKASCTERWLTVSPASGQPGEGLELTLEYPDAKGVERTAVVTVKAGDVQKTITVHQDKVEIDEIELELHFSDGETGNQPFTTNLTTTANSAKNLGVKDYIIKETDYHVEIYGSYIGSLLNSKGGLLLYPYIGTGSAYSNALRNEGFAFLHLPAIPGYKLTSLQTITLSTASSTQDFPVYITPTYGNTNAEAIAAAIANEDVGRNKTTDFVFSNSVAGVGYYIFMPAKTSSAVAASYQFGTITATYAK